MEATLNAEADADSNNMESPRAETSWRDSSFLMNGNTHRSVHRSQLGHGKFTIVNLSIRKPDGTLVKIEENDDSRLKIVFTGGTDDPSLELRLAALHNTEIVTNTNALRTRSIIFKYSAFVSDQVTSSFSEREVLPFQPSHETGVEMRLQPTKHIVPEPVNFTDSLYDVFWELDETKEHPLASISFKSKSAVTFGQSLLKQLGPSDSELAAKFSSLSRDADTVPDSYHQITVRMSYTASLEHRFRYLLASENNLQAFWRYRTNQDVTKGSVAVDLCERYPWNSAEIYNMEKMCPTTFLREAVEETYLQEDGKYHNVPLRPMWAFSSAAEAEFYMKGSLLYELHSRVQLLEQYDGYSRATPELLDEFEIPIAIYKVAIPWNRSEETVLLRAGDPVSVTWVEKTSEVEDEDGVRLWEAGRVLAVKCEVGARESMEECIVEIIVRALADRTGTPFFRFSCQQPGVEFLFQAMDKFLFPNTDDYSVHGDAIRAILMGRDNHGPVPKVHITGGKDTSVASRTNGMDDSQRDAFRELLSSAFTIVLGPPGSGKRMLAAKLCCACLQGGEKVLVITRSKTALKDMFDRAVGIAEEMDLPPSLVAGMKHHSVDYNVENAGVPENQLRANTISFFACSADATADLSSMTALVANVEDLDSTCFTDFMPTVLVCLEGEILSDHLVIASCGLFFTSIKKVAILGDPEGCKPAENERNHLREQYSLTTMTRLLHTGFRPFKLAKQYHMDPEIAEFPLSEAYLHPRTNLPTVSNSIDVRGRKERYVFLDWVSRFLGGEPRNWKASVFINVEDGVCLQLRNSFTKINHQHMITTLEILYSMIELGISPEDILVLTFYPLAVPTLRKFYHSQGIKCRVEHVASERIKAGRNLVVVLDCTAYKGIEGYDTVDFNVTRLLSCLMLPEALRVLICSQGLGSGSPVGPAKARLYTFWMKLRNWHVDRGLVKDLKVGGKVLDYEHVLYPRRYMVAGGEWNVQATRMYDYWKDRRRQDQVFTTYSQMTM